MLRLCLIVLLFFASVNFTDAQTRRRLPKKAAVSKARNPQALSLETKAFLAALQESVRLRSKLQTAETKLAEVTQERDGLLKQVAGFQKAAQRSEKEKVEAQRLLSTTLWIVAIILLWRFGRFVWRRFRGLVSQSP